MQIKNNLDEIRNSGNASLPEKWLYEVTDQDIKDGVFEIPNGISIIGKLCFYNCETLKKIIFPDTDNWIVIRESAFYQTNIEELTYNGSISIFVNAFCECKKLKRVYLPEKRSIGDSVFCGCTALETVDIHSIDYMSIGLFRDCISLKKIKLSKQLRSVGRNCFENCCSLTNLTLPNTIEYIGESAFKKCSTLDLVIDTSLFDTDLSKFKYTFDVKSLTIYNNEIDLNDSLENITRKMKFIQMKEIETLVKNIICQNNINVYDISKQDSDKIEEAKQTWLKEITRSYIRIFIDKVTKIIEKYKKNLPALGSYNSFISKSTEEIYNIINNFNPNVTIETIDDIQKYGSKLVFFPTYITSSYLDFVRTRNDYNETIIKMKDVIDRLTKHNDKKSLIKKIFLRKNSNKNKLELNTEFINDLNDFINVNEVNLREELKFLEEKKKLLEIFINKLEGQIEFILNYDNETLSSDSQIVLLGKSNDLKTSLLLMKSLSDKIGILGASNIVIYNKLELLKNTVLPKIILDLVIDNKIERNESTINALNSFSKTLEEVIVLNEENREVLKIDTSDNTKEDEKSHSKRKIKN